MRSRYLAIGYVAAALSASVFLPAAVAADPDADRAAVATRGAPGAAMTGDIATLRQRVADRGLLRVIVTLRVDPATRSEDADIDTAAMQQVLPNLQGGLLQRVGVGGRQGRRTGPGVALVHLYETVPMVAMRVNSTALGRLLNDPEVVSIQEDVAVPPQLKQSVPLINADDVWKQGATGSGWVVAILDTGVDKNHPMLRKVGSEACYPTTSSASTSVCPGGVASSTAAGSGLPCASGVNGCNHGTHVAGIAAGNQSSLKGVAKDAKLISVQVFSRFDAASSCTPSSAPCVRTYTSDQIKGLERVYSLRNTYKIAAVNMSLGGGSFAGPCDSDARKPIIDNLRRAKIATVIASGNDGFDGSISAPGCISTAVSVGSTTKQDKISSFTNFSEFTRLLAPGESITSALPGGGTGVLSGTSMAAPHVAGAWAALASEKPGTRVDEMLVALGCGGKSLARNGNVLSRPRIDVQEALNYLNDPLPVQNSQFSGSADLAKWAVETGSWSLGNGYYSGRTSGSSPWSVARTAYCGSRYQAEARIRRIDVDSNPHWNSGLFIKTRIYPNKNGWGYWFAYNKYAGGQAVAWRIGPAGLNGGNASGTLLCQKQRAISVGGFNTIKVVADASTYTMYINGTQVCQFTDSYFPFGRVAAGMAGPTGNAQHVLDVDYVKLSPISGTAPLIASAAPRPATVAAAIVGMAAGLKATPGSVSY